VGKRKVTILDTAVESVAKVALFIEGKGMPEKLSDLWIMHSCFLMNYPMKDKYTVPAGIFH